MSDWIDFKHGELDGRRRTEEPPIRDDDTEIIFQPFQTVQKCKSLNEEPMIHNPKRKKSDGGGRGKVMMGRLRKGCNKAMKQASTSKLNTDFFFISPSLNPGYAF